MTSYTEIKDENDRAIKVLKDVGIYDKDGKHVGDATNPLVTKLVDTDGVDVEPIDSGTLSQQIKDYGTPAIITLVTPLTPVRFIVTSTPCIGVMVTAGEGNVGSVSIGKTGTVVGTPVGSRTGIIPILNPGASVYIPITNMNLLYLDGITANNTVSVIPVLGGS